MTKFTLDSQELTTLKELLKQAILQSDVIEYVEKHFPLYMKIMKEVKRLNDLEIPF